MSLHLVSVENPPAMPSGDAVLQAVPFSGAHDILTEQSWDQVSTRAMIERTLMPFQENRAARFELSGQDVTLDANPALLLAMVLHELATNAVKYGALSNDNGHVALSWDTRRDGMDRYLSLKWVESGGPAVSPPSRRGFGSTLIERALNQEQGKSCFEFRPEGVICSLDFKL